MMACMCVRDFVYVKICVCASPAQHPCCAMISFIIAPHSISCAVSLSLSSLLSLFLSCSLIRSEQGRVKPKCHLCNIHAATPALKRTYAPPKIAISQVAQHEYTREHTLAELINFYTRSLQT